MKRNKPSLWICGRALRTSLCPSGRVDKAWITKKCYPHLDHSHSPLDHITTGSAIGHFFSLINKPKVTPILRQRLNHLEYPSVTSFIEAIGRSKIITRVYPCDRLLRSAYLI